MVDMKSAVKTAIGFIEEFFPGAKDIRLEEVYPYNNAVWSVVVSFKTGEPDVLSDVMRNDSRIYKVVSIETDSGSPFKMESWKA